MTAWSLSVVDESGEHGCGDCKKRLACESRQSIETMRENLASIADGEAHPERSGWGVIRTICYGWVKGRG